MFVENIINKYDIFCFDLDDTIVKTEKYHHQAWLETIQENIHKDFNITFEEYCSIFHCIKENHIQNYLINTLHINNYEDIKKFKNEKYYKIINENKKKIKMVKGCEKLINKILENNKNFVIVSNTLKEQIDFFLELFPILKNSTKNYYRELLKNKKPNPECYLHL